MHRRKVTLDRAQLVLEVVDQIVGDGDHQCRLAWHLGPSVECRLDGHVAELRWVADHGPAAATLTLPTALRVDRPTVASWRRCSGGTRLASGGASRPPPWWAKAWSRPWRTCGPPWRSTRLHASPGLHSLTAVGYFEISFTSSRPPDWTRTLPVDLLPANRHLNRGFGDTLSRAFEFAAVVGVFLGPRLASRPLGRHPAALHDAARRCSPSSVRACASTTPTTQEMRKHDAERRARLAQRQDAMTTPIGASAFTTRFDGPAPERDIARDIAKRGLHRRAGARRRLRAIWGWQGAASAAYAIAIVMRQLPAVGRAHHLDGPHLDRPHDGGRAVRLPDPPRPHLPGRLAREGRALGGAGAPRPHASSSPTSASCSGSSATFRPPSPSPASSPPRRPRPPTKDGR